jgi:peptidoglycan/LPS O-acetylase OafA/YrhL
MASNVVNQVVRVDYVPTLDGWRAIAVLGVVCFHCAKNDGMWPGSIFWKLAVRGHIGVDIFFAISGFLICGKLLQEFREKQTISLKSFYIRRCFRIFPALWFYLAILGLLTTVGWIITYRWEFGSTLLFVRNYFPLYHNSVLGEYTAQFWSLGVEEYFYLLWAGAMLFVGPKISRIGWATLILALSVFAWRSIDSIYGWWIPFGTSMDTKTDTRIDALLWGCLAAVVYPSLQTHLKRSTLQYGLWAVIGLVAATVDLKFVAFSLVRAILFPAMLLATAMSPASIVGRFLELPVMRWIGRISYSMYIWQQLAIFPAAGVHSPLAAIQRFPYNISVVFVLAAVSYYIVELPMIRLGRRVAKHAGGGQVPTTRTPPGAQTPDTPLASISTGY